MTDVLVYGWYVVLLAIGTVALYAGAELLVAGAGRLALGLGLRAATVGVTVVAMATTAPELFVSLLGVVRVSTDIGLGAIVGSNVANIGLVLGIAALIRPMSVSETTLRRHVPFMVLAALLLVFLGFDGQLGRLDGVIFLATLAGFTVYLLYYVRADPMPGTEDLDREIDPRDVAMVVLGLLVLALGSHWLIGGGRGLLSSLGFSDLFIGLTILAFGTSLPELAASVIGAVRDNSGFSVGNAVGSNVYNILAVLGIVAVIVPISIQPVTLGFEFPALVAFTLLIVAMMYHNRRLTRLDGAVLLVGYVAFIAMLYLRG